MKYETILKDNEELKDWNKAYKESLSIANLSLAKHRSRIASLEEIIKNLVATENPFNACDKCKLNPCGSYCTCNFKYSEEK